MKKYSALLVGAGEMGGAWADTLAHNHRVKTVGWIDILPGAAAQKIENKKLAGVKPFEDLNKALAETQPDFVVDVTDPAAHLDVTLASLAAGAAVLGEKPMTDSMDSARQMVAAGEKAQKLFMVSQSRRYHDGAIAFRALLQTHLGKLAILNSDFFRGSRLVGFRDQMPHVLLLDMAIHTFDSARFMTGTDPVSVYCEEFQTPWSWHTGLDSANALFEMTGGLRYAYRGSWSADGLETSWESQWRAHGSVGAATWNGENLPVAMHFDDEPNGKRISQKITGESPRDHHGGISGSLREFIHSLDTGDIPNGECHDNIKSLAMVFSAIESADAGKRVKVRW